MAPVISGVWLFPISVSAAVLEIEEDVVMESLRRE
jgi:hypothetical protein